MYDTLMNLSLSVVDSHKPNKQQKEIGLIGNVVAVPGQHDRWRHDYRNIDLVLFQRPGKEQVVQYFTLLTNLSCSD